ncbi:hypothetical protein [Streptomyces sp. AD55]|uniref:hypothetical protein n=1 Tax=Streptomyces sp. AD55 TaxID=3242895 RepID=UPI00352855A7
MTELYYRADSEDGDRIDDPSEDALFLMIGDLDRRGNTFLVVRPDEDDPPWSASVTLRPEADGGGYEVVRRIGEAYETAATGDAHGIAHDLTRWTAARTGS